MPRITTAEPQPSFSVTRKEGQEHALRDGSILEHQGIFTGTLVMPRGRNLPSWFWRFRDRLFVETVRARQRLGEYISLVGKKWFYVKPRPVLEKRRTPAIAVEIYESMNMALAKGDLTAVQDQLAPGLLASLRSRIQKRSATAGLDWTLLKHVSPPELASFRFEVYPGLKTEKADERSGIVQAIVRLHTLQALMKTRKTHEKDGAGVLMMFEDVVDDRGRLILPERMDDEKLAGAKETVEYFVIQKVLLKGKMGPWTAWGTAEETTVDKLREDRKEHQAMLLKQ